MLKELGLDFGAVDVIWNEHESKAYVLEINTAPGLEGSTVEDYKEFFNRAVTERSTTTRRLSSDNHRSSRSLSNRGGDPVDSCPLATRRRLGL